MIAASLDFLSMDVCIQILLAHGVSGVIQALKKRCGDNVVKEHCVASFTDANTSDATWLGFGSVLKWGLRSEESLEPL